MCVGVADLDLELLAGSLDGVIVEDLDDLLAVIAGLEAGTEGQYRVTNVEVNRKAYRAKPTPRP